MLFILYSIFKWLSKDGNEVREFRAHFKWIYPLQKRLLLKENFKNLFKVKMLKLYFQILAFSSNKLLQLGENNVSTIIF